MADSSQHQNTHQWAQQKGGQDLQQKGQEAIQRFKQFLEEKSITTSNIIAFLIVFPLGLFLLGLSGITFIGSLFSMAITGPLFILFSPVIVPALLTIGLAVMGFLSSGACGLMGLSAFSWIINFFRSYRSGGDEGWSVGGVSQWAREKAGDMGQKVKDMGQYVADKARDELPSRS
ncbi:oleosin Ara h 10.0102-like [Amaranthus tricolor]|uniref:oleosin Ara h 10.0102-like n=1 Tax=Amaranthus tricolor TaxID=29722 RepID=UPI00258787A4|nr:oleosin Ara h 10.0102-like [Amaranthus tricolor]